MTFRVAIDVTAAVTQRAGVGRYARELVRSLSALPERLELAPFYAAPTDTYPLDSGLQVAAIRRSVRSWRFELLLRHLARVPTRGPWDGATVYHATDIVFPPVRALPVVATVHDLSFAIFPEFHTRLNGGYLRLVMPIVTRRASLVIADSVSTMRDLVDRTGLPERKIRVVYPGISDVFHLPLDADEIRRVRQRYALPGPFILSVGTLEPRKNLTRTLRAYRLLRGKLADAPPLALVGGSGWRLDELELGSAADAASVLRLGYVPDNDLAALYASCSAFVYPSLYEGWGLPVAEALSLGAPTITSTVSSLPEVAGDAAILVNPQSVEEIAHALEQVLTDSELATQLRRDGPIHAAQFSSEQWARATLAVYCEARGQ